MFDELNDSDPPVGDSHQFAAVTERARIIRRRLRRRVSAIGVAALIAGGAVIFGATSSGSDREIISTVTPEISASTTTLESSSVPTASPTTTMPESTTTGEPSTTNAESSSTTIAPAGPVGSEPITAPTVEAEGRQRALVAITGDGDAVYFPTNGDETTPVLIYDGPDPDDVSSLGDGPNAVDRVEYSAVYEQTVVGLCCAPVVGTVLVGSADRLPLDGTIPDNLSGDTGFSGYGYAPTLDPEGGRQVTIGPDNTIVVADTTSGFDASVALPERAGDAWDLAWLDTTTIMVIGRGDGVWTRTMVTYDFGSITVDQSFSFATLSDFADLRFAGTAIDGEIAVHDVGTGRVLSGDIDDYGNINGTANGSSLQVVDLPAPALSAWFYDPGQLIWVDTNRTLRVGDQTIPGEFTWARR